MQLLHDYNLIAQDLQQVKDLFENELVNDHNLISDMLDQVGQFRGKMLRPVLVLLCGQACGSLNNHHHVIAAVTEMVHLATLVHDDVLDEARLRRGRDTLNTLHGNEAAVILGDLLISHAFHLCSSLESQSVSRMIAASTNTVCAGELIQLHQRGNYHLSEEHYLDIITRKTAGLIAACCYLGAGASGADEKTCQALQSFGLNLGIAYQILDDITDLVGNEDAAGKTLGTDMALEKITLPCIHFLENSSAEEKQWLQTNWADPQVTNQLRNKLIQSGSIDFARQRANQYIETAQKYLAQAWASAESSTFESGPQREAWDILQDLPSQITT